MSIFVLLHQVMAGSGESISMKPLCLNLPKIGRKSWQLPNPNADRGREYIFILDRWISGDIYPQFAQEASSQLSCVFMTARRIVRLEKCHLSSKISPAFEATFSILQMFRLEGC